MQLVPPAPPLNWVRMLSSLVALSVARLKSIVGKQAVPYLAGAISQRVMASLQPHSIAICGECTVPLLALHQ